MQMYFGRLRYSTFTSLEPTLGEPEAFDKLKPKENHRTLHMDTWEISWNCHKLREREYVLKNLSFLPPTTTVQQDN